ncbi:MAG: hypothetical protein IT548_12905 [Alphaproteobacteria bacterium]|nr:hypothetical protein [Alphaproteobacteria bacterium]
MRLFACLLLTIAVAGIGRGHADATLYRYVATGSLPVVPSIDDPGFQADALAAHNVERRLVGAPPLVWSTRLAEESEAWAAALAKAGVMQHAPQRAHGENLWSNTANRRTVGSMIGGWSIEKYQYIPGALHPNVSKTRDWHAVGHYTQMVWSTTTQVGCAIARGGNRDYLVCRYAPIGNWVGQAAYSVAKAPKG